MSNYDHYKEIAKLILMLQGTKLEDYGEKLQSAIAQGATGTEIFMALRWHLQELLSENDCGDLVKTKALQIRRELDRALQ